METLTQLGNLINEFAMRVGNFVKNATNSDRVAGGYQLYADTAGKLQSATSSDGSLVNAKSTDGASTPLLVHQDTSTLPVLQFSGIASEGLLTTTIVEGTSSSVTQKGFVRIYVTGTDTIVSTGFYYMPFGILA